MLVYLVFGGELYGSGGWAKYVRELAAYLTKRNYRVKILCRMGKLYANIDGAPNYLNFKNVHPAHSSKNPQSLVLIQHLPNPLTVFLGTVKLSRDIQRGGSCQSVLHIHDISCSLLIASLVRSFYKLPLVVQIHGFPLKEQYIKLTREKSHASDFAWFVTKTWHNLAMKFLRTSNAIVLVNNKEVKAFYELCGMPPSKIRVVPSAIDLHRHENSFLSSTQAGQYLNIEPSKKETIIGYVGELRPEKNLDVLIDAFKGFVSDNPQANAKLVVIGAGPLRNHLEETVNEGGLGNYVSFLGFVPDASRFLSVVDILVLPSLSEGSPLSLIEAMLAGKAIIASNISAIREIVEHEKEALLFNPHSAKCLEAAILSLYRDSYLRIKLGANARKKAELYDVHKVFERILSVYDELVYSEAR